MKTAGAKLIDLGHCRDRLSSGFGLGFRADGFGALGAPHTQNTSPPLLASAWRQPWVEGTARIGDLRLKAQLGLEPSVWGSDRGFRFGSGAGGDVFLMCSCQRQEEP